MIPRSYLEEVANVVKRSVSFPAEVFQALEEQARAEGVAVSAAITEAATQWLQVRRGLRAVAHWEAENGALTADELEAADALLEVL